MARAEVIYETSDGEKHSKSFALPAKRYNLGIYKQREGHVVIGYFLKPPETGGYGKNNYVVRQVSLPRNAAGGSARLKVGRRIISRAR